MNNPIKNEMKSQAELDNGIPKHLAIIMDGNGRWATKRFLPRVAGHAKGVKAIHNIVEVCLDKGIKYLTLFAFSSENWRRPADEVSVLMQLFRVALRVEVIKMNANNVRLKVVGDLSKFEPKIQEMVRSSEQKTEHNTGLTLTICANYGGQWDLVQAGNKILADKEYNGPITEELLNQNLAMAYAPEPDLLIRTGGESRVSNFLLWQMAYTELYFTDTFWPDFGVKALDEAIASYQSRERRFGRTSEQVTECVVNRQ
jgi:undecaprenyl diphosphate synthase